jgi:hypothetical protein
MVDLALYHQLTTNTVPPLGEGKLTLGTKTLFPRLFMLPAQLQRCNMVSSTIVLVGYKGMCDVRSTFLNQQRRYDMKGIFQMQGGKNWILPK